MRTFVPRRPFRIAVFAVLGHASVGSMASAATLTAGNLVASVNEFTGSSTAPTYVAEYTVTGSRVQTLANVPPPGGGAGPTTEEARDLVVGPGNAIFVYNGTFTPTLSRLNLGTLGWTHQSFAGWSTINNISFGGVASLGNYVYACDMSTGGGSEQGVVRFDTTGGPAVRFATTEAPVDLYISPSNVLYTLSGGTVKKFDPITLAPLGSVSFSQSVGDARAIGVAADDSIFIATWDGQIIRFAANGSLIESSTPGGNFADIDIDATGRIALGTSFSGELVVTDLSLDASTRVRLTDSSAGGEIFVNWVAVPEAGSSMILLGGVLAAALRRRG